MTGDSRSSLTPLIPIAASVELPVAVVERPANTAAAVSDIDPSGLYVIGLSTELDIALRRLSIHIGEAVIEEVAISPITGTPDAEITILTSAPLTSIPAVGRVGHQLGEFMRDDVYERISDIVSGGG